MPARTHLPNPLLPALDARGASGPVRRAVAARTGLGLLLTGTLLCLAGQATAAGRTIVGEWAPDPRHCTPMAGAIDIRALAIVGDAFRCDFGGVARTGDVVRWRETCGFPGPARPMTVVATLRGETLAIRYDGGAPDVYRRCRG